MKWKITGLASGLVLTLILGLIFGMNFLGDRDEVTKETAQSYSEHSDKTIAIVNLDSGVMKKNESKNYATPIIESLSTTYKMVPFKMAQEGLKSGIYDAVVCFPADFSRKASSVNTVDPEKIKLDYEVNKVLPEDRYIETYEEVLDLQTYINSTLSYVYIYSLYDEFHIAQGSTNKVFKNDRLDLDEVGKIKAYDFRNNLDLTDMPEVRLDLKELDFESYVKNVKNYAGDMTNVYMTSYSNAKKDYAMIAQQVSDEADITSASALKLLKEAEDWESAAENWRTDQNTKVDSFNTNAEIANEYTVEFNKKVGLLCEYIKWLKEIDVVPFADYANELQTWYKHLKDYNNSPTTVTLGGVPSNLNNLEVDSIKVQEKARVYTTLQAVEVNQVNEELAIDAIPVSEAFTAPPTSIHLDAANLKNDLVKLRTTSLSFDPLAYLTQSDRDAVNGIVGKYGTEVMTVKGNIDTAQTQNLSMLSSAFNKYNMHIGELRTDTAEAYEKEHKSVEDMVKSFISVKTANSLQNRELLEEFVSKIPNSKTDASVNSKLVDFVAEPVTLVRGDIRDALSDQMKLVNVFLTTGTVLLSLLLALSIIMIVRRMRRMGEQ